MDMETASISSSKPQFTPSFEGSPSSTFSQPKSSKTPDSLLSLESQEIRDERAREARAAFNEKDEAAKQVERQAADARKLANESKKAFYAAKDEACATRFGGKLLCLRPWWSVGY